MKKYNEICITKVASTITSLLEADSHEEAAESIAQVLEQTRKEIRRKRL